MARQLLLTVSALLLLQFIACSSSRDEEHHRFRTFVENGVSIAENTGGPRYLEELFYYEHIASLRGDISIPESLLPRPGAFSAGNDGYYYVLDTRDCKVAVFNSNGEYVRSFGAKGSGPGEFRLMKLQSLQDGVISIFDLSQQRTSRFNTDGTLIDVLKLPTGGRVSGLELTNEGSLIATSSRNRNHENLIHRTLTVTHLTHNGADTLASITSGEIAYRAMIYIGQIEGKRAVMDNTIPFSGRQTVRYVGDDGILLTDGIAPNLYWYDFAGTKTREVRLGLELNTVTEEMKKKFAESVIITMATIKPEWIYPEYLGYWNDVHIDASGFIWLEAVAEVQLRDRSAGTVMHVVSPDGEYLGVTELPCRFEGIAHGLLLGYQTEEESGERIPVAYSMKPAVKGLKYPN